MDGVFTLQDVCLKIIRGSWRGAIGESNSDEFLDCITSAGCIRTHVDALSCVGHQDRVVILTDKSVHSAFAFLAVWMRGAVVVPMAKNGGVDGIKSVVEDCEAKFIYDPIDCSIKAFKRIYESRFQFRTSPRITPNDLSMIIYTSGSTGRPKGIMLTHGNAVMALRAISNYLPLCADDSILCIPPLTFDYGLYQLLLAITNDCRLVLFSEAHQPLKMINAINRHKVTCLPALPPVISSIERIMTTFKMETPSLRMITNTGGHLSTASIQRLQRLVPAVQIYRMYGLTECKRALYSGPTSTNQLPDSVGAAIPGMEAKVFVEHEQLDGVITYKEAETGVIGELFVRGGTIMQGYYSENCGAGARIIQGEYRDDIWLATGDLFSCDEEGMLYFKGRKKELIKQGGHCLYPKDLEEIISRFDNVEFCKVIGIIDDDDNEIARLFVQLGRDGDEDREHFRSELGKLGANYRPRQVQYVSSFELTENGKIDIAALEKC